MSNTLAPIEVFCSYVPEDEIWLRKLETHLNLLKHQGLISTWHTRLIIPGTNWEQDVDSHLKSASIFLLLISADFLASDYCAGIEMQRALQRQDVGEARVLPILVHSVEEMAVPFAHLQVLPTNAKPLSTWDDKDTALTDVITGIRRAIEDLSFLRSNLQSQKAEAQHFFTNAGFRFIDLDDPTSFLCLPATSFRQKKIKHEVYARILTNRSLDRNDILRIYDSALEISKDITLAFAIVDKPIEDHVWLQIAVLRAQNFNVIPIPLTLLFENQTAGKAISAVMLLDKHLERFLRREVDPYDIRHPVFDVLNFFGREALASDLMEQMNARQPIGLFGLRKMGKSSLMQYMRALMPCPTAFLDLQAGVGPIGIYERLLHSWDDDAKHRFRIDLGLHSTNLGTGDLANEFVKITQVTLDKMMSQNLDVRLAIFLDEIEFIIPPLHVTGIILEHYLSLMHTLRGLVQEDGRILLMVAGVDSTINRISRWGDEQKQNPFFMWLKELYLPPLIELDCIQMIRNIGTQVQLSYTEEATSYIAQMSGGHPYLARQLCSLVYEQRGQQPGEVTQLVIQQAVERFLFDPKYASSINAYGLWGEVTNVRLWGEQAAKANQDVLFTLAQSRDPVAKSVIINGSDQVALHSTLFSLHELSIIHLVEDSFSSGQPYYVISFGLFHSWIRRIRLGLEG